MKAKFPFPTHALYEGTNEFVAHVDGTDVYIDVGGHDYWTVDAEGGISGLPFGACWHTWYQPSGWFRRFPSDSVGDFIRAHHAILM